MFRDKKNSQSIYSILGRHAMIIQKKILKCEKLPLVREEEKLL